MAELKDIILDAVALARAIGDEEAEQVVLDNLDCPCLVAYVLASWLRVGETDIDNLAVRWLERVRE